MRNSGAKSNPIYTQAISHETAARPLSRASKITHGRPYGPRSSWALAGLEVLTLDLRGDPAHKTGIGAIETARQLGADRVRRAARDRSAPPPAAPRPSLHRSMRSESTWRAKNSKRIKNASALLGQTMPSRSGGPERTKVMTPRSIR